MLWSFEARWLDCISHAIPSKGNSLVRFTLFSLPYSFLKYIYLCSYHGKMSPLHVITCPWPMSDFLYVDADWAHSEFLCIHRFLKRFKTPKKNQQIHKIRKLTQAIACNMHAFCYPCVQHMLTNVADTWSCSTWRCWPSDSWCSSTDILSIQWDLMWDGRGGHACSYIPPITHQTGLSYDTQEQRARCTSTHTMWFPPECDFLHIWRKKYWLNNDPLFIIFLCEIIPNSEENIMYFYFRTTPFRCLKSNHKELSWRILAQTYRAKMSRICSQFYIIIIMIWAIYVYLFS